MNSSSLFNTLWPFSWPVTLPAERRASALIQTIENLADSLRHVTDAQLQSQAADLRQGSALRKSPSRDIDGTTALALVYEAMRRSLGLTPFSTQLQAALALLQGRVAEMQTGEGKTLAVGLAAAGFALAGRNVHVATPNGYLADRDRRQLAPLFTLLGISATLLPEGIAGTTKRNAYHAQVTYGTGYEFGFDYLRDQLTMFSRAGRKLGERHLALLRGDSRGGPALLQDRHDVAILDEIDSVLIDEACVPLILAESEACEQNVEAYQAAQQVAGLLQEGTDFGLDRSTSTVSFTPTGLQRIHVELAAAPAMSLERPWTQYVQQALKALHLLHRDVDYVVSDGKISLVDQSTGRIFADRAWQAGLHQAVEIKEGVVLADGRHTAARMTRQRYFQQYATLCGTTGTAQDCAAELRNLYNLQVVTVPLGKPSRRVEWPTRFFSCAEPKWHALVEEVQTVQGQGRPVLIGARTIETSRQLAQRLSQLHLPFRLLNGVQDEQEAAIVARAGETGAVTIATNMAGRGTDIQLGHQVAAAGGLHVIGVERQESRRVDRQLIGRAGRQGDPGSGRFFVSADDALLVRWDPALARRMKSLADSQGSIAVDLSAEIVALQQRVETEHFHTRRQLLAYDHWLDEVRGQLGKTE